MQCVTTVRKRMVFSTLAVCFALAAACGEVAAPKTPVLPGDDLKELPRAKLEDGVFLQAGDIKIMNADIEKILLLMLTDEKKKNPRNVPAPDRILRSRVEIAQVLLQNAVIQKFARDNKLETSKEDLDKFMALKKSGMQNTAVSFEQMLADSGQSETEYRTFWGAKLAIEKFAATKLTDAEITDFYNKNKDTIPLRSAAHILFQYKGADAVPRTLKRTEAEAKALAEDALKQAKAGKDFSQLAASSSDDEASKGNGGALEYFSKSGKDTMVKEFTEAVYALEKVGDLTPVVKTPYGYHIIKLTGLRDDEIRVDIKRYLAAEKFNELLRPVLMKAGDDAKFSDVLTAPK